MTRKCELTGKSVQTGNKVSHSQRKTRRRFLPNLQNVSFLSQKLNLKLRFRASAVAIKTVDSKGGIDEYLIDTKDDVLSDKARKVKKVLEKKYAKD